MVEASPIDNLILIGIMLLLMATGVFGIFNLGANISPMLDTSFGGSPMNILWTIILRFVVGPLMVVVPGYIIYNIVINP